MRRRRVSVLRSALATVILFIASGAATAVRAQQPEPVGPFAIDARGALPKFDQSGFVAGQLGVATTALPRIGLGVDVGAHWYPLHLGPVTLGIGASLLIGRATRASEDPAGEAGPTVESRLVAVAPQLSLNFGTGRGWSYLSGGLGPSVYDIRLQGTAPETYRRTRAINYGGGARWFAKPHLAFSLDLRFYALNPQDATDTLVAIQRTTLMVFSAGVSFK